MSETKKIEQIPQKSQTEDVKIQTKTSPFEELYKKLSNPIPSEFLITYNEGGKEFTGYHAQYAIDLLNEVVGLGRWDTNCEIRKEGFIGKGWAVGGGIKILIKWNGHDFTVNGFGGSFAKDIANAYKGFKTSSFKNACRYLGIGKELYVKGFEEDLQEVVYEAIEDLSEEGNNIAKAIDDCKNIEELDILKDKVQASEGKAVKEVLLKKYNEKKIILIEGK